MKTLEIRRHSLRKHSGGSQLSQEGVEYARALGASMGPFARVVTSIVPRARETAIAMGFAVDYELVPLVADDTVYAEAGTIRWDTAASPFAAIASVIAANGAACRHAHAIAALWRDMMTALPDGARALVIGHSGELEMALITCFPHADHRSWGALFGPCEGARLTFAGEPERWTALELLRAP